MSTNSRNGASVNDEVVKLQERIAELERQLDEREQVEQALRSEVSLYSQTLDAIPSMILVKGRDFRIHYANRAFRECYGMTMDALRDLIDAPFVEPDYTQQYVRDDEHVFTSGQPLCITEVVTRHDGTIIPCETIKLPVSDETGRPVRLVAVIQDIRARKQAEDELNRFFDMSLDMLCMAGFDGYFKRLNPNWSRTLGFSNEELMAEPFLSFVHPDDQDATVAASQQVSVGHDVVAFENRYRCKDGSYRWIEWRSTVDLDQQLIYAVARDITERKQAETTIRENEQRLTQFLDGLPIGVFVVDGTGQPYYANQMAQEILGRGIMLTSDETNLAEVYSAYVAGTDQLYPVENMPLTHALHGRRLNIQDMEIHQQDRKILLDVSGASIFDAHGSVVYAMATFSDISERVRAEEAVRVKMVQEEVIRAQSAALQELSTPLIPISDQVMVMPLVGTLDSRRAQQIMDVLLQGIAASHARIAIVDITGVPVVDSQVADALVRAAQAVRLLGAQVVLTGIRPDVAQTLVGLGIDLGGIVTQSTLQSGIAFALNRG